MTVLLGRIGAHLDVRDLQQRDVNQRPMFECFVCKTFTRNKDHFQDIACSPNCKNCEALRRSNKEKPAWPEGETSRTLLYTCPHEGNRWWQSNDHYHLWQQVTDPEEWQTLNDNGYGECHDYYD